MFGRHPKKVNKRTRSASRLRENIAGASEDVLWSHVHDWHHHDGVGVAEIADRLKLKRGKVYYALEMALPPSQRKKNLPPPVTSAAKGVIKVRQVLVRKIALETEGEGKDKHCKFPSAKMIADEMQRRLKTSDRWHPSTVYRDLMAQEFKCVLRPLTGKAKGEYDPVQRVACIKYIMANVDVDWLIFSDEKWFDSNDHGHRMQFVPKNGKPHPKQHSQHCTTAHFWGAIGKGFRLLIEFPPEYPNLRATSCDFIHVVLKKFAAEMQKPENKGLYTLQQDGLSIHLSVESCAFLDLEGVGYMLRGMWPSWSPDLSPIENIWELMHVLISRMPKKAKSEIEKKAELARHVWKAWSQISQDTIDKYVASASKRFVECLALNGEWTDH